MTSFECACCGGSHFSRRLEVPEMYFGTRELFAYRECNDCHSLNIESVPPELSHYYREGYGGHFGASALPHRSSAIRRFIRNQRTEFLLHGKSLLGRAVNALTTDYFPYPWNWLRTAGVARNSRILDVGCGGGGLLKTLYAFGFTSLRGADAFVRDECSIPGLSIVRQDLMAIRGKFDFIMLHHSLEHIPDPVGALRHLIRLLSERGVILVRIPVADCEAFHKFAEHWYQIDAPRHVFIPSIKGMAAIANRVGLSVFRTEFDSTEAQFVVSEGYRLGIPLTDQKLNKYSHVSAERSSEYQAQTMRVNLSQRGDQAAFFLRTNK